MSKEKQHKKKRAEEIGIQIQQNERLYEKQVEEDKKLLYFKEQEYNATVEKVRGRLDETKKQILLRAGNMLLKYGLEKEYKISGRLKRDFKGYIHRSTIYFNVPDSWRDMSHNQNPKGINRANISSKSGTKTEPLTQQEQEYVKTHEEEVERDQRVMDLLQFWTGKTVSEQGTIIGNTPKGENWRKKLLEESKDHMVKIAKRMTDSHVGSTLHDLRTLTYIGNGFSDILYEEQETRRRKKELTSA